MWLSPLCILINNTVGISIALPLCLTVKPNDWKGTRTQTLMLMVCITFTLLPKVSKPVKFRVI